MTLGVQKRFSDGFQLNAHYTWSQDKDTDSNERSATGLTMTNGADPGFDYGFSERDIQHRFVLSGLLELPLDFQLSGILTLRSGSPYTGRRDGFGDAYSNHPGFDVAARAVDPNTGRLVERNGFRNDGVQNLDLRLSKFFMVQEVRIDLFAEAFNVFDTKNFSLGTGDFTGIGGALQLRDGSANPEFGLADTRWPSRQFQLGARVRF